MVVALVVQTEGSAACVLTLPIKSHKRGARVSFLGKFFEKESRAPETLRSNIAGLPDGTCVTYDT
jgi:hypothetical protein